MRTRNGLCYPKREDAAHVSCRHRRRKRPREEDAATAGKRRRWAAGVDMFEALPDDLVVAVLCKLGAGAASPADLVSTLLTLLSGPKARTILLNGSVRKGERLVPPAALDLLMQVTFPPSAARVKATERFEAVYPTLKELALAGSPATKTTKQASQQILPSCIKPMQEID